MRSLVAIRLLSLAVILAVTLMSPTPAAAQTCPNLPDCVSACTEDGGECYAPGSSVCGDYGGGACSFTWEFCNFKKICDCPPCP